MPRILPNAHAVGRNVTKVKLPDTAPRRSFSSVSDAATTAVRMGQWVFTPACVRFAREVDATLHDKDRCIDLRYSSSVLEDFLKEMGSIEADFVSLWSTAEGAVGSVGQQAGQRVHA